MRLALVVFVVGCAGAITPATPERHDTRPADPPPSHAAVIQVAVGIAHSCALHDDGTVSCWGANEHRQLDVPGADVRAEPIRVPGISDAVELVAHDHASCVRRRDGSVTCWGLLEGLEGVPTGPRPLQFEPAVQIAGHCARTTSGAVQCLRSGNIDTIVNIAGATDVANMRDWGCAVVADGKVACWRNTAVALPVPRLARAVQVVVGAGFGCARLHSGHVKCWPMGEPEADDSPAPRAETPTARGRVALHLAARDMVPFAVPISDARSIVSTDHDVCAIRRTGTYVCSSGEEPTLHRDKDTEALAGITSLAVGPHSCALARAGVWCWGIASNGELGNGWSRFHALPVPVPDVRDVVEVVANTSDGEARTCVRHRDGSASCFGNVQRSSWSPTPMKLEVPNITAITATELIAVIDRDGVAWNPYLRSPPERLPMPPAKAIAYECAVTVAGKLYCFGNQRSYNDDHLGPVPVPNVSNVVALAAHSDATCFVRGDGTAACYSPPNNVVEIAIHDARAISVGHDLGGNPRVCLVRANATVACTIDAPLTAPYIAAPTPIAGLSDVRSLAIGTGFGCAAVGDGRVLCWGANPMGQLGDGTQRPHDAPAPAVGVHDAIAVTVGSTHACALIRDGTLMCWGGATEGQIGTLATNNVATPQLVPALSR